MWRMNSRVAALLIAGLISAFYLGRRFSPSASLTVTVLPPPAPMQAMVYLKGVEGWAFSYLTVDGGDYAKAQDYCSDGKENNWHYKLSGETGSIIFYTCRDHVISRYLLPKIEGIAANGRGK